MTHSRTAATQHRRKLLHQWLQDNPGKLKTSQITDCIQHPYDTTTYWSSRNALIDKDLHALEQAGRVKREPGYPTRWQAI